MIYGIRRGDIDLVRYHIHEGVNLNYEHPEYMTTPLMEGVVRSNYNIVELLLQSGADPTIRTGWDDKSPLDVAIASKNEKIIELIKKYHPDQRSWLAKIVNVILRRGPIG